MSALTTDQLYKLAYDAGFRGDNLKMAVAIALAESGGNPAAYNPEVAAGTAQGSGSRGLWQIYGTAHPRYNSSIAFDPVTNARAAFEVFQEAGGRFTPWSTFNNGMAASIYNGLKAPVNLSKVSIPKNTRTLLRSATQAAGSVGNTTGNAASLAVTAATNQAKALQSIASGEWISNAAGKIDKTNLSFFLGGFILILIGLFVMFKQPIIETTKNAANLAAVAAV